MYQMKLSPLGRSQRAQKRMVEQLYATPEAGFTLRNDCVHCRQFRPNLISHLLSRQASRPDHRGGFSSGRHVTQSHDHKRQQALRHGCPRGERLCLPDYSLESCDGSGVGEIQMFQHLRRAPLAREMPDFLSTFRGGNPWHYSRIGTRFRVTYFSLATTNSGAQSRARLISVFGNVQIARCADSA
jgi:hypothetical protein